jgi:hypothetical protein
MTKESSSPPVTLPPSSASDPSGPVVHRVDEFGRPVGQHHDLEPVEGTELMEGADRLRPADGQRTGGQDCVSG